MDEAVKSAAIAAARTCAALAFFSASCAAGAQALQDPTRPPAAAAAGHAAAAAGNDGPRLQTVLVGRAPGGRHMAVIDGETVRPGDDFHGARVASIKDDEVVLVRGRERQVLRLHDTAAGGMTPVARKADAAGAADAAAALAAAQR